MPLEEQIRTIIATQLRITPDTVTPDATLQSLGADSLDIVELIMRFEDEFKIEINDADAEALHTVADVIAYIAQIKHAR